MARFEVTYEDVAFRGEGDDDHVGLPTAVVVEMDEGFRKGSAFPPGFVSFLGATSSPDDSVHRDGKGPDGDTKLFVSVRFLVEADDVEAAEGLPVPQVLLSEIQDAMSVGVDFEGNWEFADADGDRASSPGP